MVKVRRLRRGKAVKRASDGAWPEDPMFALLAMECRKQNVVGDLPGLPSTSARLSRCSGPTKRAGSGVEIFHDRYRIGLMISAGDWEGEWGVT